MYDFSVLSDRHVFYSDGILSHNSTSLAARSLINTHLYPNYRSLYVVPSHDHLKTYADKLRELERLFKFYVHNPKFRQNLYYKEYPNGSIIKLINVLTSSMNARSNTADEVIFDEYQNFDSELEEVVLATQTTSSMPITIYSGTSITTDTALEMKYSLSSRGTYHIKCGCGHWLDTGNKDVVLDFVQPKGVTCPKCSRVQDVRNGEIVHEDQELLAAGLLGFHVPQIVVPSLVEDPIKWARIYSRKMSGNSPAGFMQEILGIPTEEGAREITEAHLRSICVLKRNEIQAHAKNNKYLFVVSGCDWGGSDYVAKHRTKKSLTVHAMLGINQDRTADIIHFQEYSGMDWRSIAQDIVKNHNALGGTAMGSDAGAGSLYNLMMREMLGNADRHLILQYTGPSSAALGKPHGESQYNQLSCNRTESITSLYEWIKSCRLRCYEWPLASDYLVQFLALHRTPSETASGATSFTYHKHGAKTDDPLHAVNFALIVARLLLNEPLIQDEALRAETIRRIRGGPTQSGRRPGTFSFSG